MIIVGLFCTAVQIPAQETTPAKAPENEEIVQLSPFEVSARRDEFHATDAASASLVPMAIQSTPLAIEVMTEKFVKDLGITDSQNSLKYVSGGYAGNPDYTGSRDTDYLRGFNALTCRNNNKAPAMLEPIDSYNLDRIEVVKNPLSTLYGVAQAGGVVNYVTKMPDGTRFADVKLEAGDYSFYRSTIDLGAPITTTGPLIISMRVNAMWQTKKSDIDWLFWRRSGLDVALRTNALNKRLTWLTEFEQRYDTSASDYVDVPRKAGSDGLLRFDMTNAGFGYGFSAVGPNSRVLRNVKTFYNELTFTATNWLTLHFSASDSTMAFQWYGVTGSGVSFLAQNQLSERIFWLDPFNEFGEKWDALIAGQVGGVGYGLTLGYDHYNYSTDTDQLRALLVPFPNPMVRAPTAADWVLYPWNNMPISAGSPTRVIQNENGLRANLSLTALQQKLHILAGIRQDRFSNTNLATGFRSYDEKPTWQAGAMFNPTPQLAVYFNDSTTFLNQTGYLDAALTIPAVPLTGHGWETGIKWNLLDGRLSGTSSFFNLIRNNLIRAAYTANNLPLPYNVISGGEQSEGIEFDTYYSVTDALRLNGTFTHFTKAEVISDSPYNPQSLIGRSIVGAPDYSFTIWADYRFKSGKLKGLDIALGDSYVGKTALVTGYHMQMLTSEPVHLISARCAYNFKLYGADTTVAFLVTNLLNKIYVTGIGGNWGETRRMKLALERRF